jgi:hypothetical protein
VFAGVTIGALRPIASTAVLHQIDHGFKTELLNRRRLLARDCHQTIVNDTKRRADRMCVIGLGCVKAAAWKIDRRNLSSDQHFSATTISERIDFERSLESRSLGFGASGVFT